MEQNWNTIINQIINKICEQKQGNTFMLREIFPYIPMIIEQIGSIGKTPKNTISRVTNGLPTVTKYLFSKDNKCWIYKYNYFPINSSMSHGEQLISNELSKLNITFESQKRFKDLKYKGLLAIDFYIPEYKIAIEFDGLQHFAPVSHFGGDKALETNKLRDNIKDIYCKNNEILLIRIKYDEYKKIPKIINNIWGMINLPFYFYIS